MRFTNDSSSSALSRISSFPSAILLLCVIWCSFALAIPNPIPVDETRSPPSKYPSLDDCRKAVNMPKDKAFFWSQIGTKYLEYASFSGLIWDKYAYPPGFTDRPNNREKEAVQFARDFFQAFAEATSGTVHILVPWKTPLDPSRTFPSVELKILLESLKNGKITELIHVNPDNFRETQPYKPNVQMLLPLPPGDIPLV